MIHPNVKLVADDFKAKWSKKLGAYSPILELDGTWPSLGVLDLLTFSLRFYGKESSTAVPAQLDSFRKSLLKGASAYLACLAYECWSTFGYDVSVGENKFGIFIEAQGEKLSEGQRFIVDIESELNEIFKNPPQPFPVINGFQRHLPQDYNLISLFGLGLMTGLSPFGDGPWRSETADSWAENIKKSERILAKSSADHYARLFPNEIMGQVPEVYLSKLIFPPTLMGEKFPVLNAVEGMVKYFKELGLSEKAMSKVALNFAQSPDELISLAGIAFYVAVNDEATREIVGAVETKGTFCGLLRQAMIQVRKALGKEEDWLELNKFTSSQARRFHLELELGFLPWVKISQIRLNDKQNDPLLVDLLFSLSVFDLENAIKLAEKIIEDNPGDFAVRLQLVYLEIIRGDVQRAELLCKSLASEPGAERWGLLFNLWGMSELAKNESSQAVKHFEKATLLGAPEEHFEYQFLNDYAWALMLDGQHEKSLSEFNKAIGKSLAPVTALLNKAYVLRILKQPDQASLVQDQLVKLSPLDLRVFGNLIYEIVEKEAGG
jgi:tetratricopeptide (TPR) repeat protein